METKHGASLPFPTRLRWLGFPILFLLAAAGGRLTWLAITEPRLTLISPSEFQDVLIGAASDASITVRNVHPWKTLRASGVRSSCGCVYLEDRAITISPRSNVEIPITLKLGAYDESSTSTLYFSRGDDDRSAPRLSVSVNARAPFRGWPDGASARRAGGHLIVDIDRRYVSHIVSAQAAPIGSELRTIDIDPLLGVMKIPSYIADGNSLELLLAFGDPADSHLWNGYVDIEHEEEIAESESGAAPSSPVLANTDQ